MEATEEKIINLYKQMIHSLEHILHQMNSNSNNLDTFGQLITGAVTLLDDFIKCDLLLPKDRGKDVIDYGKIMELLHQIITWLFICM